MAELLPCPFCGGIAGISVAPLWGTEGFVVKCKECFATSKRVIANHPNAMGTGILTEEQAKTKAIEAWNRRT